MAGSADPVEVDYDVAQRGRAESRCVPEEKYAVDHELGEEGELTPDDGRITETVFSECLRELQQEPVENLVEIFRHYQVEAT